MKRIIPNILTIINLTLGVLSIILVVDSQSRLVKGFASSMVNASLLIILSALVDRIDGKVARALGVTSELGKQLDSLSDLVSFGIAPIAVAWKVSLYGFGAVGYLLAVMFPIAGAYRLARYNISNMENLYIGMPITVAGAFLVVDNLYNCFSLFNDTYKCSNSVITAVLVLVLSILMVSTIKVKKV